LGLKSSDSRCDGTPAIVKKMIACLGPQVAVDRSHRAKRGCFSRCDTTGTVTRSKRCKAAADAAADRREIARRAAIRSVSVWRQAASKLSHEELS